jgi:hypothetical protein
MIKSELTHRNRDNAKGRSCSMQALHGRFAQSLFAARRYPDPFGLHSRKEEHSYGNTDVLRPKGVLDDSGLRLKIGSVG